MIRRVGVLAFIGFLILTLFLYRREEGRRLAEHRGLLRLVTHLRDRLAVAPLPLDEIYATFHDESLSRAGFLKRLETDGLAAALDAKLLHLSAEELRPVREYAAALGTRPYAEEKKKTEELCHLLSSLVTERETAFPTRTRLVGTLFFSGGVLLLLLIL